MKLTEICITSTAEAALKKLKKASIAVYDCEKRGADFLFRVKDKDLKKVFAIFSKPCYNVRTEKKSALSRMISATLLRAGLVAGASLFVVLAAVSNLFILRIEVHCGGSFPESEITAIVEEEGGAVGKPFSSLDKALATGRLLALPGVTFCNISKRGSVLVVDLESEISNSPLARRENLVSDLDGVVKKIVAVCGTPAKAEGDAVKKGEILIYAHNIVGDNTVSCLAVGYADIQFKGYSEISAPSDSTENRKSALASIAKEGQSTDSADIKVRQTDGGVIFEITYLCTRRLSINLT